MAGIVSPRSFVELELAYFEPLGIKRPEDRKKLFFLIQKVKSELEKESSVSEAASSEGYDATAPLNLEANVGRKDGLAGCSGSQNQSTTGRHEVGMSVNTDSSRMDPISPVTLSSPLSNEYDIAVGQTDDVIQTAATLPLCDKLSTRARLEKELQKRRAQKELSTASVTSSHYSDDFDSSTTSRKSRRSSMLPRISKKELTTPATISTGRKSMHSRPTVKKGNQSIVGIRRALSRDEDDESIGSETSDLSSSIQSYNSNSSSIARTRSSRTSIGTYSTHTNENRRIESKLTSRIGNKRLSTIPSTGVAPISPLAPLPSLSSNLNNRVKGDTVKKSVVSRRKSMGRPGTANSTSSYNTTTTNPSLTSKTNRPSSRASIGSIGSRSKLTATTTTTGRTPGKSPSRSRVMSPIASRGAPRGRSVSPVRGPVKTASPYRGTAGSQSRAMSPTRNIKTAGSYRGVSPTRSIKLTGTSSRGISPRRVQTATSRERSPTPARSPMRTARSPTPNVRSPTNSGAVFVHGQAEDKSWGVQIAQLREAFDEEHVQLMKGQEAYQEDDDYEMRIRVIVRKRPMSKCEALEMGDVDVIHPLNYIDHGKILVYQPKTKLDLAKEVETTSFAFDNVFDEESNNVEIYGRAVRNLIPGVFRGKWASGKSMRCDSLI